MNLKICNKLCLIIFYNLFILYILEFINWKWSAISNCVSKYKTHFKSIKLEKAHLNNLAPLKYSIFTNKKIIALVKV